MSRCLALLVLPLAACTGSASQNSTALVRDSAGIRIVENTGPNWSDGEAWHLSLEPLVEIGVVDGDEAHMLNGVRGLVRLQDGRIVVADGGSAELRFFDETGRHLMTVGGKGQGPGELPFLYQLVRFSGDTLGVGAVSRNGRFNWFDSSGHYLRQAAFDMQQVIQPPVFAEAGHALRDGSLLIQLMESRGLVRDELFWPRMGLLRVSWDGTRKDSIGWFTRGGQFFFDVGGRLVGDIQPFTWDVSVGYSTNHIFVTSSDRYEIEAFGYDGTLERIIRRMVDPIPVTEGDREKLRTRILEFADRQNRRADYERWLARVPFSENKPAIESIVTDELNNLWVRPTQPAERNSDIWTVFGPDGSMLGDVAFPKDLCVRRCGQFYGSSIEIGDDYLLATMMDEFDVERVQLYNLIKPGS